MGIVMPLRMGVEILERCDIRSFAGTCAVVCQPTDLGNPAQSVCFLKKRREMIPVTNAQPNWIHCKSLELELNYQQRMIRYAIRIPQKIG